MSRRDPLVALVALVALAIVACGTDPAPASAPRDAASGGPDGSAPPGPAADLADLLAPVKASASLPALAALVLRDGVIVAEGATGLRRADAAPPVTTSDAWQLGGAVQAITSTLAGVLVERGKTSFGITLGEALPDVPMHAHYSQTRLDVLLMQRSGFPSVLPPDVATALAGPGDPRAARREAARLLLAGTPEVPPDSAFHPTDAAFLVAAVVLERATDRAYEDLVREEVFVPLAMTSCSVTADPEAVPWGHLIDDSGAPRPIAPGADAPPASAPARSMRCSLRDWAKLTALHLAGARREPTPLLAPRAIEALHTASDGFHALGLELASRPWAGEVPALVSASHEPSSMALAWIAPAKNVSFVVVTNRGDSTAVRAVDGVVGRLVERFVATRR